MFAVSNEFKSMKTYCELQQLSHDWLISITTSVENIITRTYVEFENIVSSLLREFNRPKRLLITIDSPPLLELLWKWALGTRFALPRLPHTWNITFVGWLVAHTQMSHVKNNRQYLRLTPFSGRRVRESGASVRRVLGRESNFRFLYFRRSWYLSSPCF